MKIFKKLIQMPFIILVGIIGVIICAHYEFYNIFIRKWLPTLTNNYTEQVQ